MFFWFLLIILFSFEISGKNKKIKKIPTTITRGILESFVKSTSRTYIK